MRANFIKLSYFTGCVLVIAAARPAICGPYEAEILSDNPIAYWRFEETSGTTAVDSAGISNGTYSGVVLGQSSAFPALGSAGVFDGVSSFVEVPALGTVTDLSIEAWVYVENFSEGGWTSLYDTEVFAAEASHWQFQSDRFEWALGFSDLDNEFAFSRGAWYYIVTTYNHTSGAGNLFVNGELQEELFAISGIHTNLTEGRIGAWETAGGPFFERFLDGWIDEVAIYGATLPVERIEAHYAAARSLVDQGDFNHDGTVDAADYVVWRKTDGTQSGYDIWRAHFGQTAGSGYAATSTSPNATVPEPKPLVSFLLGVAAMRLFPRRRVMAKNRG